MNAIVAYGVVPGEQINRGTFTKMGNAMLAFCVFLGGFVIFEPAPYELLTAGLLGVWFLFGLKFRRSIMPLVICLFIFCTAGFLSVSQTANIAGGLEYNIVTLFLALTSIFFASVIADDMGRLRTIFRAYVLAGVLTSLLGIIGYFNALPGFEIFTLYTRAKGAFQDPNVFGPFVVAPIIYLIYGLLTRSIAFSIVRLGALGILVLGVLLAFSRAAWGLTIISAVLLYILMFVNEQNVKQRMNLIVLAIFGVAAIILLLVVALQFEAISSLFTERAQVVQNYDGARLGRFARHFIGFGMALERPLGLGPLEFGFLMGEDTHNMFLKTLMGYGWLGFASYLILVGWTLGSNFKLLFRPRPWQPYLMVAYSVFLGHLLISWVIDVDHWRHFYLLLGVIWGCYALETKWQRYQNKVKVNALPNLMPNPAFTGA